MSALQDEGDADPDPQGEFMALLAAGATSTGLHSFLSGTLGEAGLRRLARAIDNSAQVGGAGCWAGWEGGDPPACNPPASPQRAAQGQRGSVPSGGRCCTCRLLSSPAEQPSLRTDSRPACQEVHAVLLERLLPTLQLACFLLGELKGLAGCPGRLGRLGIQAGAWRLLLPLLLLMLPPPPLLVLGRCCCGCEGRCSLCCQSRVLLYEEADGPVPPHHPPPPPPPHPPTPPSLDLQAATTQQLEAACAQLLVRAEQVRAALCAVAPAYRSFFSWLLRVVRLLEFESAQQGACVHAP